jgi:pyruvate dehydrogenase kinase 2/3/4
MSWKKSSKLMDTIRHYANFPATGVSLRQMVQFGERPSVGKSRETNEQLKQLYVVLAATVEPSSDTHKC